MRQSRRNDKPHSLHGPRGPVSYVEEQDESRFVRLPLEGHVLLRYYVTPYRLINTSASYRKERYTKHQDQKVETWNGLFEFVSIPLWETKNFAMLYFFLAKLLRVGMSRLCMVKQQWKRISALRYSGLVWAEFRTPFDSVCTLKEMLQNLDWSAS